MEENKLQNNQGNLEKRQIFENLKGETLLYGILGGLSIGLTIPLGLSWDLFSGFGFSFSWWMIIGPVVFGYLYWNRRTKLKKIAKEIGVTVPWWI